MIGHVVPALRGKDYGKTKMRYPDYTETESGLQYKVIHWKLHLRTSVSICSISIHDLVIWFNFKIIRVQDLRQGSGPMPKMGETVVVRR